MTGVGGAGFGNSSGSPGGYGALFLLLAILGVSALGWATVHYPVAGWILVGIVTVVVILICNSADRRDAVRRRMER